MFSTSIEKLVDAFTNLPGIGRKTAQRLALHLLQKERDSAQFLVESLTQALNKVQRCQQCRNLTESTICSICNSERRNNGKLCVVETPMDLYAIESTYTFDGVYFVLHGHFSPIEGIGANELEINHLVNLLVEKNFVELILATNLTTEGEATAHYITESCRHLVDAISRIAQGVPLGGELEYVDGHTLAHAFKSRK